MKGNASTAREPGDTACCAVTVKTNDFSTNRLGLGKGSSISYEQKSNKEVVLNYLCLFFRFFVFRLLSLSILPFLCVSTMTIGILDTL
jgi:hypothetical protein